MGAAGWLGGQHVGVESFSIHPLLDVGSYVSTRRPAVPPLGPCFSSFISSASICIASWGRRERDRGTLQPGFLHWHCFILITRHQSRAVQPRRAKRHRRYYFSRSFIANYFYPLFFLPTCFFTFEKIDQIGFHLISQPKGRN